MERPAIDTDDLAARFERFNEIGATDEGGVSRPALSDANKDARELLVDWLEAADLTVSIDELGNIFGRRPGAVDGADPVLVGSHIDSQYRGGRFDGVIGVLGGLAVVQALNDAGSMTDRPIEVVAWTNEEGVRFQPDLLGSGVFAGIFEREEAYASTDESGTTVEDALTRIGYKGSTPCAPRDIHRYFELHVEQGPVLDDADCPAAAVEGVVGFTWLRVRMTGQADHAGPTPMTGRRDALVGASDVVTAVRRLTASAGEDLVGTVGSLTVEPNGINVIPEVVEFTVDLRSFDSAVLETAVDRVREEIRWAAKREDLTVDIEHIMTVAPTAFDPTVVDTVERAIERTGAEPMRLVSGAGHDASYLDRICPAGMLFVPSVDGISHSEDEYTEWSDVVTGTQALLEATRMAASID